MFCVGWVHQTSVWSNEATYVHTQPVLADSVLRRCYAVQRFLVYVT